MTYFVKPTAISGLAQNIGLIFFASLFVGPLADRTLTAITAGERILASLLFWTVGIFLAKE